MEASGQEPGSDTVWWRRRRVVGVGAVVVLIVVVGTIGWMSAGDDGDGDDVSAHDTTTTTGEPAPETTEATSAAPPAGEPTTTAAGSAAPPGGDDFYVDPDTQAGEWVVAHPDDPRADVIRSGIVDQPSARWFGDWTGDITAEVAAYTEAAATVGDIPVMVAYNVPGRDCGQYSSGGAASPEAYQTWIAGFAAGLGDNRAVVVLEPDAVAQMLTCGMDAAAQTTRRDVLRRAVATFAAEAPNASVYLDAGNADWVDPGTMAAALADLGVADIRGFAVNVSNYKTTEASQDYAAAVNAALPQPVHFVVDTSRNGNGPVEGGEWCNPRGAEVGVRSQWIGDDDRGLDAYVWVKSVGESDGECTHAGRHDPPAGTFDPGFAYALATGDWSAVG